LELLPERASGSNTNDGKQQGVIKSNGISKGEEENFLVTPVGEIRWEKKRQVSCGLCKCRRVRGNMSLAIDSPKKKQ